jgi:hypothetical protein
MSQVTFNGTLEEGSAQRHQTIIRLMAALVRPGSPPQGWARVAALLVVGALAFCGLLAWAGAAVSGEAAYHFGEKRLGTLSSVAALAMSAAICISIARQLGGDAFRTFWRAFGILLMFVAADDLLRFHEKIDRAVHIALGWDPNDPSTDSMDDWIVAGYGVIALYLWGRHCKRLLELRWMMITLAAAFVGFAAMVVADMTGTPKAIEETFKNTSAALIVAAFLAAKWDPRLALRSAPVETGTR